MKKFTATGTRGGCAICGVEYRGPWLTCSELCTFLLNAEEIMANETVADEIGGEREAHHGEHHSAA